MGDTGYTYRAMSEHSKNKRAFNRDQSAKYLNDNGIIFSTNNNGAHLIIEGKDCYIDFWPGTGKWKTRKGHNGFGVKNLVDYINT